MVSNIDIHDKEVREGLCRVAKFIEEFGIENLVVKKIKAYDVNLMTVISTKLQGLKTLRHCIITNAVDLNDFYEGSCSNLNTDSDNCCCDNEISMDQECYVDQELMSYFSPPPVEKVRVEARTESISSYEVLPFEDMDKEILFQLSETRERQERIESKLDMLLESIPQTYEKMDKKIKILEDDMVNDVRKKIHQMIIRYSSIKFGGIAQGGKDAYKIQLSYNEMYNIFSKFYKINLDEVQATTVNLRNNARIREGFRPMNYVNPDQKGHRKIDTVEQLGMLTELYLIVKDKLIQSLPQGYNLG